MKHCPTMMKAVLVATVTLGALVQLSCPPPIPKPTNYEEHTHGITVDPTFGLVTTEDGGSDSFTVVLDAAPTADVTIGLSSSDPKEGTVSPLFLTFTQDNWNKPQRVTVTGVDDAVKDGDKVYAIETAPALGSDTGYSGLNGKDVAVTNRDNDLQPDAIDQEQAIVDRSTGVLAIGGSSQQKLAQVVTAGISGPLLAVKVPVGGSSGDLIVEIQGVTGDTPNGTVLTVETFNGTNWPAAEPDGFRRFAFSTPVNLTAGSRYAMVLSSPAGSYSVSRGPEGNPYPGGDGFYDARPNTPGVWVTLTSRSDLPFKTVILADVTHGVIGLDAFAYTVAEEAGSTTITVNRTQGTTGTVSVHYATGDGTARAGDDYASTSGTLVWNDGDAASKSFAVSIIDDNLVEPEEELLLTLSAVSGGAILRLPSTATLSIADNDTSEVVDQQQAVIDKTVGGSMIGGSSQQKLAQVVTVGTAGPLLAVRMPVGGSSGDLIVEVQGVTAGKPDGTVLTTASFNNANYPAEGPDGMRRFAFPTLIDFAVGDRFAIVLRSPGGSYGIFRGPVGDPYSGGNGYFVALPNDLSTWVQLRTRLDLPFKTIVSTLGR